MECILQWRIQDFPKGGAPTPKIAIIFQNFAENCMKMKEFGPLGGRASLAAPLDPPMFLYSFVFTLNGALYNICDGHEADVVCMLLVK